MKVSDQFWRPVCRGEKTWTIEDAEHDARCHGLSELDARLICDLHNAAIVQRERGWTALKCSEGDQWHIPELFAVISADWFHDRIDASALTACYGSTPRAAILAANKWIEEPTP